MERQLASARRNTTNYALFTYDHTFVRWGRVQIYDNLRRAKDDIRDDVIEWVLRQGSVGGFERFDDPLAMRNAWANTLYLGYQGQSDRLRMIFCALSYSEGRLYRRPRTIVSRFT